MSNIQVNGVYEGTVKNIVEFGVFVELVRGTDGLLHISKISRDKQQNLKSHIKVGDKLTVKVISMDPARGRIGLVAPSLEG